MKYIPSEPPENEFDNTRFEELKEIKPLDIVILVFIVMISLALLYFGFSSAGDGEIEEIVSRGNIYRYNLNENRKITVEGELGEVVIEVKDGNIRMLEDESPRQIGVKTGWVSMAGFSIICLPCKVSATIVSDQNSDDKPYDAVVE